MKTIFKFILSLTLIMIIITNCFNIYSLANQEVNVYFKEECGNLLKKDGKILRISYVVYNNNNIESPVYCLEKDKPGAGEVGGYIVSLDGVLKNTKVWRAIKNGYPYKTPEQLNCNNYKEAFAATKMAVYSVLYNYDINSFEAIGESGQRTLEALKRILEKVNSSSEKPFSSNITITEISDKWQQDEINKDYIYKILAVKAQAEIKNYNIYLGNEYPEGTKITDKNNNYRESFSSGEEFKVSIPIKELKANGTIDIKAIGTLNTKPIYIGKSLDSNNQNYAITQMDTEKGEGNYKISFADNKTAIKIIKKDEENNNLQNAIFELLDENKNVIYTNQITNEQGEVYINNLMPGKYYIKEIKAPEGYEIYNDLIEVKVSLNEELSVIVNNTKEEQPTIRIDRNFIEVSNIKENIKLPKTGM